MRTKTKTIGILGGMGPHATLDLFGKIIEATPAQRDQEHFRILVDNNPRIPDRTQAILGQGRSPLPMMIETAKNLERAGADFIVIPCHTAHFWLSELQESVSVPIIDMVEETARAISTEFPHLQKVGLIATTGTIKSQIYHQVFKGKGWEVLTPKETGQKIVMRAIYGEEGIKTGELEKPKAKIIKAAQELLRIGAEIIVAGCTEVSLVLRKEDLPIPVVDPTKVLAKAAVREATLRSVCFQRCR
ncbi:MAG: aspartate/glutamate racemase family protein [bacterium]